MTVSASSSPARAAAAPWVSTFVTRDGYLLYHDLSGRTLRLRGAAASAWQSQTPELELDFEDGAAILAALQTGGFVAAPGTNPWPLVADRHLVRARWAVYAEREEGVWLAERDAFEGGPWAARLLDPLEALVWRLADGRHTVAAVVRTAAARFGPAVVNDALEAVLGWTHGRAQLLKLIDGPLADLPEPPPHFFGLVHDLPHLDLRDPAARRAPDAAPGSGPVDLDRYHREAIASAHEQFELRETTLSHLLRLPSPVLGGRSYGEAWVHTLTALDALPQGARVLEVGAGTGWLARRALEHRPDLRWHIVDLSPALLRDQRALLAEAGLRVPAIQADATTLPVADATFDLVVANEVIADLPTAVPGPEHAALLGRLGLNPPPGRPVNLGALALIERIAGALRPGGWLWLSEFGTLDEAPREAVHLDHPETGIEFGVLAAAAQHLDLVDVSIKNTVDALGIEPVPLLAAPPAQLAALNALLVALGGAPLATRAWDAEAFAAAIAPVPPECLRQVGFAPATERINTFPPRAVQILMARKPG